LSIEIIKKLYVRVEYEGIPKAKQVERDLIEAALRATDGNKTRAAQALGISLRGIRNKVIEYGLSEFKIEAYSRKVQTGSGGDLAHGSAAFQTE